MMTDELLDDAAVSGMPAEQQQSLVAQWCSAASELVAAAPSRDAAVRIAEEHCAEFDRRCLSSVLRTAVRSRITAMIEERWRDQ